MIRARWSGAEGEPTSTRPPETQTYRGAAKRSAPARPGTVSTPPAGRRDDRASCRAQSPTRVTGWRAGPFLGHDARLKDEEPLEEWARRRAERQAASKGRLRAVPLGDGPHRGSHVDPPCAESDRGIDRRGVDGGRDRREPCRRPGRAVPRSRSRRPGR
ncbi:DUF6087 family protein [Streptomyces tanashiensis]|uniref:DUF6087 family protein n=1 Tax=Streptomyces tanashiensis TaxID=67367 RepID=UPI0034279858